MKLHLHHSEGNVINACGDDFISVNGERHEKSLIISPTLLVPDWSLARVDDIDTDHLREVAKFCETGDVVILGVGVSSPLPNPEWQAPFAALSVPLEVMSLRAACRTYNILCGDGRKVIAALLLGG